MCGRCPRGSALHSSPAKAFLLPPSSLSLCSPLPLLAWTPSRFRSKYHPEEAGRRKQEAQNALQNRLHVFLYLMDSGWFEGLQLDIDKANAIIKVLDAGRWLPGPAATGCAGTGWPEAQGVAAAEGAALVGGDGGPSSASGRGLESSVVVVGRNQVRRGQSSAPCLPGALKERGGPAASGRGPGPPSDARLAPPAVIKMEGGTEHDLKVLEQEEEEERQEKAEPGKKEENRLPEQERKLSEKEEKKEEAKKAKVGREGRSPPPV